MRHNQQEKGDCAGTIGRRPRNAKERVIDPRIRIRLDPASLDPGEAHGFVSAPEAGGTAVFVGSVRSPNAGAEVDHLDYEIWDERAQRTLEDLAHQAIERFGVVRAYLAHRSGRVGPGEPSVIVAVSTPHRAEAFEACRYLIDELKASAPIWKKEVTVDGTRWVGASG